MTQFFSSANGEDSDFAYNAVLHLLIFIQPLELVWFWYVCTSETVRFNIRDRTNESNDKCLYVLATLDYTSSWAVTTEVENESLTFKCVDLVGHENK